MKPVILAVSADPPTVALLERDLPRRYSGDYETFIDHSTAAALRRLKQLRRDGADVALVVADLRLERMTGIDFLVQMHALHSEARRLVLIEFIDPRANEEMMRATTLGWVDAFVNKPWDSPEELLYPAIGELLSEWATANLPSFELVRIVGNQWSPATHLMRDLLTRNPVPHGFYDADSEEGRHLIQEFDLDPECLPAAILYDGRIFSRPTPAELAAAMGAWTAPSDRPADVVIVGAGPAGLAAAVYGASEGLETVILEQEAVGGQAGTSSKIRNYLGFPRGVSGRDLARRAFQQALLFGANIVFMNRAVGLRVEGERRFIVCAGGGEVEGRAIVIATGVSYRRLDAPGVESLTGKGVYYGAAVSEAPAMRGQPVFVAGAGNSAGQAAIHLAKYASSVTVLVRGDSLAKSMSDYLVREIEGTPTIHVLLHTEVAGAHGSDRLEGLDLQNRQTGAVQTVPAAALFVLIGAEPHTEWVPPAIERDARGFILTGRDLMSGGAIAESWPLDRPPYLLETSLPGVFAVGDVRHRSMKRVASAVGEGSTVISLIHEYLREDAVLSPQSRSRVASGT